eukprot:scaffold309958_cov32-Tisochrysis_lutea.AAC.3
MTQQAGTYGRGAGHLYDHCKEATDTNPVFQVATNAAIQDPLTGRCMPGDSLLKALATLSLSPQTVGIAYTSGPAH